MYKNCIKRVLDFLISLTAAPFVLILIVIMAPIIYFDDSGPIFYSAERYGKNGKTFKMLKFRSMFVNSADIRNSDGSTYNGDNDPRVTKIGRIMRKTSIDEVPQFLNVLIGDMSLIGPRPILATTPYDKLTDLEKRRLQIRPGITGYAQAYYRNSISQEEKFERDCEYIEKISFWTDIKIFFKTTATVLKRDNIYVDHGNRNGEIATKH